jgi:4-hydroxy-tetrahydrodipicolinate synthase
MAHSIVLSQAAEAAGADGLLVVTPYYNRPTQEGLYRHFLAIADAVGVPIVLYNVPGRTACDLLPATIARLSGHARIVGVKEATGDLARATPILRDCRPGFVLLSGDDPSAADLMRAGARGVISVTANVVPRSMHELCAAARAGRHDEAGAINQRLMRLHRALFVEPNPIPVKWALVRMGLIGPGQRLPLTPLAEAYHAEVLAALRAGGVALP